MGSDSETTADIIREMREESGRGHDLYQPGHTQLAYIYIGHLADRIEAAHNREVVVHGYIKSCTAHNCVAWHTVADLRHRLKIAEDALEKSKNAMCNYCRSTPEAKALPCVNGCETLAIAKDVIDAIREEGVAE